MPEERNAISFQASSPRAELSSQAPRELVDIHVALTAYFKANVTWNPDLTVGSMQVLGEGAERHVAVNYKGIFNKYNEYDRANPGDLTLREYAKILAAHTVGKMNCPLTQKYEHTFLQDPKDRVAMQVSGWKHAIQHVPDDLRNKIWKYVDQSLKKAVPDASERRELLTGIRNENQQHFHTIHKMTARAAR